MKKRLISLLIIFVLILGVAGCAPVAQEPENGDETENSEEAENEGEENGEGDQSEEELVVFRATATEEPTSLDNQDGLDTSSAQHRGTIFEGLIRVFDNKHEPAIAESWDVSEDGLTYTFYLREANYADGEPVT